MTLERRSHDGRDSAEGGGIKEDGKEECAAADWAMSLIAVSIDGSICASSLVRHTAVATDPTSAASVGQGDMIAKGLRSSDSE